eukprot:g2386.t1
MLNTTTASPSDRILRTDTPCIVSMQSMLASLTSKPLSLAQGVVHWKPPQAALDAAASAVYDATTSAYGADEGDADLIEAIQAKLREENGLFQSEVMVTSGANQAFMNLVVTLLDAEDSAVLFRPFYFNHHMALQATSANILYGDVNEDTLRPNISKLDGLLKSQKDKIKLVVLTSPCNPTGVVIPKEELEDIQKICEKYGVWLVVDNTYEYFTYNGVSHYCLEGENVVNIFSFSKAFGLMGWRVGYLAWSSKSLKAELMKIQDTIPICPTRISQRAAYVATVSAGRNWVRQKVQDLTANRDALLEALEPLGSENIFGGDGAIYLLVKLPNEREISTSVLSELNVDEKSDEFDVKVVQWLARKHSVVVIPGSACGAPGSIRVAFANHKPGEIFLEACERLKKGLSELIKK